MTNKCPNMIECPACIGCGWIDIGDVEDGVTDLCPQCEGEGSIEADFDEFIPARDAWMEDD